VKTLTALLMALILATATVGCGNAETALDTQASASQNTAASTSDQATASTTDSTFGSAADSTAATSTTAASEPMAVTYDSEDLGDTWDDSTAISVTLAGGSAKAFGTGAEVSGGKVTITAGGTYVISGSLDDGQIVVDTQDKETVRLVLYGADISCSTSAPIYVASANKTIITLAGGTQNQVTDGDSYILEDKDSDEPNAAIFSKSDLTINGAGALTVTANYNNGIASKDDLKIVSGEITVEAANDGIKGRDCIGVKDATITVNAGGDGLQSNNDEDPQKGYVAIENGVFEITAGNDGVQAVTTLLIQGGDFTISTGGGSQNGRAHTDAGRGQGQGPGQTTSSTTLLDTETESASAKGLKAGSDVFVNGGTFVIDSADDTVHSNGSIEIGGSSLTLASGDDALHAAKSVEIDGGDISVSASYEGIESVLITVKDGTIHIVSSDDGVNGISSTAGSTGTATAGQGPGGETGDARLLINGGYVTIDSGGDGLDINGAIQMTGGTVIINGPTNDGNGPIDYLGEFKVTGGFIVAAGSSGMSQAPSETSTQHSIMVNFEQAQQANTLVHIEDETGTDLVTLSPTKQYQSVLVCSADIQDGSDYTVYLGGSSTGTVTDSLYSGGIYTPGTEYTGLTVSGITTISGSIGMRGGMPGGGQGAPPTGEGR